MKKCALSIAALLIAISLFATERLQFKISKPFALLVFVRAAGNDGHLSATLSSYIQKHIPPNQKTNISRIIKEYNSINLEETFSYPEYPAKRQKPRAISALIYNAAIQSNEIDEFLNRIAGILPNEQWMKLKHVLNEIEPYYNNMMAPFEHDMANQLNALKQYTNEAGDIFVSLKTFYGSTWRNDVPFTVSLYGIPGKSGNTTASPYNNSLALSVLTGETAHKIRIGVAIHEICHVLYEEQPLKLQQKLDSVFLKSKSPYAPFAYNYIDEALATACGNGWAYKQLAGKMDTGSWYNQTYINNFAKALYPMTEKYIESGRTIDASFINKAITTFEKTFPGAAYEYTNLLNNVNIFTDAAQHEQYNEVCEGLMKYFHITRSSGYYPLSEDGALDQIDNSDGTILFIIHTKHKEVYAMLSKKFAQVKDLNHSTEGVAAFYTANGRPIIIINANSISRVKEAASQMANNKRMNKQKLFTPLQ